jgi:alpha-tubulin suppressor-like RCC1 family protein
VLCALLNCLDAGTSHVAALNRRGDVLTWGFGFMGQLGRVQPYLKEGPGESAIKSMLTPIPVPGVAAAIGSDVVDIACGAYSTFAVNRRGAVAAWGLNNHGQLALPIDEAALAKEQQQLSFLQGQSGEAPAQNGGNSSAQQQEDDGGKPGDLHLPQAMPDAGEPWNHCYWSPAEVQSLPGPIKAVAGGNNHSVFLTKKHAVLTCGERNYGMLGRKVRHVRCGLIGMLWAHPVGCALGTTCRLCACTPRSLTH